MSRAKELQIIGFVTAVFPQGLLMIDLQLKTRSALLLSMLDLPTDSIDPVDK